MRIEPEIDGVGVVLIGDFNPAILTPAWFALNGLLPEALVENASLRVAHKEVTAFEADWLRLNVSGQSFSVETLQAPHVRIRDLVSRVFGEQLSHTPLRAFGINRQVHFRVDDLQQRDTIGRRLAPVEPWGAWSDALGLDGEHGGMTSLTMTQVDPDGRPKGGRINVTVEPSTRIGEGRSGVYVQVNDHYTVAHMKAGTASTAIHLLVENFDESLKRSEQIIDHVMSLATPRTD